MSSLRRRSEESSSLRTSDFPWYVEQKRSRRSQAHEDWNRERPRRLDVRLRSIEQCVELCFVSGDAGRGSCPGRLGFLDKPISIGRADARCRPTALPALPPLRAGVHSCKSRGKRCRPTVVFLACGTVGRALLETPSERYLKAARSWLRECKFVRFGVVS